MLANLRRAAATAALVLSVLAPASALADAPTNLTAEPLVIAPGFKGCGVALQTSDGHSSSFNGMLNSAAQLAAWHWKPVGTPAGVNNPPAVPSSRVHVWRNDAGTPANQQYDQCQGMDTLVTRFYNRLSALRTSWGMGPNDKMDVVGISYGTVITRACIRNINGNTPNCAAWIDDWIGLAGPAHGTAVATDANCAAGTLILIPYSICTKLYPTADPANFINRLNSVDETPGTGEFTTVWSANDGIVEPGAGGAPSGPINGAANWQVKADGPKFAGDPTPYSPISSDPTHANAMSSSCPGWPDLAATPSFNEGSIGGIVEWAAYELLDIQPHGVGNGKILCTVGPPS
ncbi:MAG: hypothetical protein J7513_05520 [Solirubrobacteraceae bacterium]|nr:hypothetical protein [Solirubrobacteraceae bacterium]